MDLNTNPEIDGIDHAEDDRPNVERCPFDGRRPLKFANGRCQGKEDDYCDDSCGEVPVREATAYHDAELAAAEKPWRGYVERAARFYLSHPDPDWSDVESLIAVARALLDKAGESPPPKRESNGV